MGVYKSITYKSSSITDKQRRLLGYYYEEGYRLNNESAKKEEREK